MTTSAGIVSEWFFSAPYEAPMIRRGDPLGLRLAAARYADALVPGLSNRTVDARWLTISAWMLVLANDVWRRKGGTASAGLSRRQAADLFGWPLICPAMPWSTSIGGRECPDYGSSVLLDILRAASHCSYASRGGLAPSPTCHAAARWFPPKWDVAVSTANRSRVAPASL